MDADILKCYMDAGKIASKVLKETTSIVSNGEGMYLLEIAQTAESSIKNLGAELAFPCNISINEIASHYTPCAGDRCTLHRGDVVKVDIGVHIDGYIADTAATVEVVTDDHQALINAAKKALEEAIAITRSGTMTDDVGRVIESTIEQMGFSPLFDLTGHSLERYNLHGNMNIPNYGTGYGQTLETDHVIAIEPFATYGRGTTTDMKPQIFALNRLLEKDLSKRAGDDFLLTLYDRFKWFPFAQRWVRDADRLDRYVQSGEIVSYPVLAEISSEIVAQFEHTVIVEGSGCKVIT